MFVVAVKSNPLCDLEVGAYASNATDVVAADRVLKAGAGLGRLAKSEGRKGRGLMASEDKADGVQKVDGPEVGNAGWHTVRFEAEGEHRGYARGNQTLQVGHED